MKQLCTDVKELNFIPYLNLVEHKGDIKKQNKPSLFIVALGVSSGCTKADRWNIRTVKTSSHHFIHVFYDFFAVRQEFSYSLKGT